ncbi:thioredoxin [Roseivivax marinus]|uniref:thioredoxin n=1 Tax=Roseivivax marinus TaxID=1379903 RepID=UPI0008C19079|nr:thioredoxin [Roseivivax marinus]UMA65201.1 thioredoxin [Roseivivax marinus]SEK54007.1 thioredoxin [Roseivivax marinus]
MIELGGSQSQPQGGGSEHIKDVSEMTFMQDVVEASQQVPVIVDFWAPWCGPCKTLGPMLEDAVKAANGAVKMAKVNVDEAQQIAAQLRIQSIPTVYAFYQGQPIDGFQGAVSQSEIKAFVDRVAQQGGGAAGDSSNGLDDALAAAEEMREAGQTDDALQIYQAVLGEDEKNPRAYAGIVATLIEMGDVDKAEAVLNGAPAEIATTPELEAAHAQIALARQAENAGPLADLQTKVEADPADHQARYDYALALQAAGRTEEAVDQLLELFRRDRTWNDEAAKTQLFTVFDALKPNDPIVLNGRRKLSSMIFA